MRTSVYPTQNGYPRDIEQPLEHHKPSLSMSSVLHTHCSECGLVAHQDRAQDSYERLGASLETVNVELLKVGETCEMAIPSQESKDEGVETRRAASKGRKFLR